jgi:hypothetical protein
MPGFPALHHVLRRRRSWIARWLAPLFLGTPQLLLELFPASPDGSFHLGLAVRQLLFGLQDTGLEGGKS